MSPLPLPSGPVNDQSWEQARDGVQDNFDTIALAAASFGGKSVEVRFGVSTVTWPGGAGTSNGLVVSHGLGRTPVVVVATQNTSSGLAKIPVVATQAFTTTAFTLYAGTVDGTSPANTATTTISWIAIG